jgi:hypothetical protein
MTSGQTPTGRAADLARRVRVALLGVTLSAAGLWGVATGLLLFAVTRTIAIAVGAGVVVLAILLWRGRAAWSIERAALWVEERAPGLAYAFVTAVDVADAALRAPLEAVVDRVNVGPLLRRSALRALWPPLVAVAVTTALVAFVPAHALFGVRHGGTASARPAAEIPNRLTPLHVRIEPPAYTRRPVQNLTDPSRVSALVGSMLTIQGRGDGTGVGAVLGTTALPVAAQHDPWQVTIAMPAAPVALRFTDRKYEQLVILDPIPDRPPGVTLTLPARDTVIREPATGGITLEATALDDIGLESGDFEYIVTSGDEAAGGVKGREGTMGRASFVTPSTAALTRTGTLHASLSFTALGLKGGDVLSVRAVVRDNNAPIPGVGTSETRTVRIATKQEYDSIAVEGAAPSAADTAYLSQRMILLATEAIARREARGAIRDTVVHVTRVLARKQDVLRERVQTLLDTRDESGMGSAIPEAERVLFDTAYQAMTDAVSELEIASPKTAIPYEKIALAMLDSVRKMQHRLYLRGTPPTIVVNIARVRLTGTEPPAPGPRLPGAEADTLRVRIARRFGRAVDQLGPGRPGLDSLSTLRVEAVDLSPALAAALSDAVDSLRAGHAASGPLLKARRMLVGHGSAGPLSLWSGE